MFLGSIYIGRPTIGQNGSSSCDHQDHSRSLLHSLLFYAKIKVKPQAPAHSSGLFFPHPIIATPVKEAEASRAHLNVFATIASCSGQDHRSLRLLEVAHHRGRRLRRLQAPWRLLGRWVWLPHPPRVPAFRVRVTDAAPPGC